MQATSTHTKSSRSLSLLQVLMLVGIAGSGAAALCAYLADILK
ncbi:hypothetical protein ACQUFY_19675 [Robbsia andropogonis]